MNTSTSQHSADESNGEARLSEDSGFLGALTNGSTRIGFVDEVNGPGGAEVPRFALTTHELLQLVRYWSWENLNIRFDWFYYPQSGSRESRILAFSGRRVSRARQFLSEEDVSRVLEEGEERFASDIDPRLWQMYEKGEKVPRDEEGLPDLPPSDEDDTDPEAEALRGRYRWLNPWGVSGVESAIHAREFGDEPRFIPTQHELAELAVYWHKVALYLLYRFDYRSTDTYAQLVRYALRRIGLIADVVEPDTLSSAFAADLRYDEALRQRCSGSLPE